MKLRYLVTFAFSFLYSCGSNEETSAKLNIQSTSSLQQNNSLTGMDENFELSQIDAATLPWKWLSGLDYGVRGDANGLGYFTAARGGGKRVHKGVDVLLPVGANLYSPCAGSASVGNEPAGYGNYVVVSCKTPSALTGDQSFVLNFLYGHLSKVSVKSGSSVSAGSKIGEVGKSGNANSAGINPHVHFEATFLGNALAASTFVSNGLLDKNMQADEEEFAEVVAHVRSGASLQPFGILAGVSDLLAKIKTNCLTPTGYKAKYGVNYGNTLDPIVLLTCLAGNKPKLVKPGFQNSYFPWSSYYSASGFDVNVGRR